METPNFITIQTICTNHEIEISFIDSLNNTGLIELTMIDDAPYLDERELMKLEKFMRLYNDLDINTEGIEAIMHLLNRVEDLQQEIVRLKNRLSLYE